jgi:hypothetical protein
MRHIDGYGYMTPVVGSLPPAARHCYDGMSEVLATVRAVCPVRHVPAKRWMIMTEPMRSAFSDNRGSSDSGGVRL